MLLLVTLSLAALPLFSSSISAELVSEKFKSLWTMYLAGFYRSVATAVIFSTFDYNSVLSGSHSYLLYMYIQNTYIHSGVPVATAQLIWCHAVYLSIGSTCALILRRLLMNSFNNNMDECNPYFAASFFGVLFVSFLVLLGHQ